MRMQMHIRIRLNMLCASVGGVVISRGRAGTALVDDAIPPAPSMMMQVMMVVVDIMPGPTVRLSDSSPSAAAAMAGADEALTSALKIGNASPANPLSTGCKIDKSWSSSARS